MQVFITTHASRRGLVAYFDRIICPIPNGEESLNKFLSREEDHLIGWLSHGTGIILLV